MHHHCVLISYGHGLESGGILDTPPTTRPSPPPPTTSTHFARRLLWKGLSGEEDQKRSTEKEAAEDGAPFKRNPADGHPNFRHSDSASDDCLRHPRTTSDVVQGDVNGNSETDEKQEDEEVGAADAAAGGRHAGSTAAFESLEGGGEARRREIAADQVRDGAFGQDKSGARAAFSTEGDPSRGPSELERPLGHRVRHGRALHRGRGHQKGASRLASKTLQEPKSPRKKSSKRKREEKEEKKLEKADDKRSRKVIAQSVPRSPFGPSPVRMLWKEEGGLS